MLSEVSGGASVVGSQWGGGGQVVCQQGGQKKGAAATAPSSLAKLEATAAEMSSCSQAGAQVSSVFSARAMFSLGRRSLMKMIKTNENDGKI